MVPDRGGFGPLELDQMGAALVSRRGAALVSLHARLHAAEVAAVDAFVASGLYMNRSDFVRSAIREKIVAEAPHVAFFVEGVKRARQADVEGQDTA